MREHDVQPGAYRVDLAFVIDGVGDGLPDRGQPTQHDLLSVEHGDLLLDLLLVRSEPFDVRQGGDTIRAVTIVKVAVAFGWQRLGQVVGLDLAEVSVDPHHLSLGLLTEREALRDPASDLPGHRLPGRLHIDHERREIVGEGIVDRGAGDGSLRAELHSVQLATKTLVTI